MAEQRALKVVVLAAGKGTRMKSELPKVLHPVAGKPMLARVVEAARGAGATEIVVVASGRVEDMAGALGDPGDVTWTVQEVQKGTGHAALCAKEAVLKGGDCDVLIMNGDLPRIHAETLTAFVAEWRSSGAGAALLTTEVPDPFGYGRVLRDRGDHLRGIVEERDAQPEQRRIQEINVGLYGAPARALFESLEATGTDNDQGEIYLTDGFTGLLKRNLTVRVVRRTPHHEFEGVNTRVQLAEASAFVHARKAEELMLAGVTVVDPRTCYVEDGVEVGMDSLLEPGVVLTGATRIGAGCRVGAYSLLHDAVLADGAQVKSHSVLEGASLGPGAQAGPFARLRPGTVLGAQARVGNFVETKKAALAEGAKASHLSYLGDCAVGAGTNVGAGTITCNYDGFAKHFTEIGAGVFVGSNSTLVAPLAIGDGAFVAAGSTITRSLEADALALGRARQTVKEGYARKLRERLGERDGAAGEGDP